MQTVIIVAMVLVLLFLVGFWREGARRRRSGSATSQEPSAPAKPAVCSFCGKNQDEVRKIIAGPSSVFICDECIDLCNDIIAEEYAGEGLRCMLCSRPKEITDGILVRDRGDICGACLDAILATRGKDE